MDIYVVIAVWCGCFDHAKAFQDVEQAKAYKKDLEKASPNHMNYDVSMAVLELQ